MGKNEEPIVLILVSAHKRTSDSVLLRLKDLETFFLLASDYPHKLMAVKKGVKKDTVSRHVSELYARTGCCCPGGLVTFAFLHSIIKKENGSIVRGWEILEDGSYRIKGEE